MYCLIVARVLQRKQTMCRYTWYIPLRLASGPETVILVLVEKPPQPGHSRYGLVHHNRSVKAANARKAIIARSFMWSSLFDCERKYPSQVLIYV